LCAKWLDEYFQSHYSSLSLSAKIEYSLQILFFIFLAAVLVQIIYLIVFLTGLSRGTTHSGTSYPPVSIIVCAHDEEQNLQELIPKLLAQDYPVFEIIVVDDRSNDHTFDWLLAETKKDHRLRMVHVNRIPAHVNGKKYGITLGVKAATHEWLLFTDADCRPADSGWIKSMSAGFNDETHFVLGYSPYFKQPGFLNQFIRFESLLTGIQYIAFALLGKPYMGVGRNLAYRKSVFLEAKGFHDVINITGGDDDLFVNRHARKENTVACANTSALVYSIPQSTWGSFFRQKIRHLSVGKFYRFKHRILLGLFSATWLITWFAGVFLVSMGYGLYGVAAAILIRILLLTVVVSKASKKFGEHFELWAVLPLDFIYAFYYLVTGLVALVSKKVRWKN